MAGKRKVNTSRKVTTSSKSIKIVARNTSARSDNIDNPEERLDYEPEDEVEHFKAPYNYCDNMVYKSFNPDKVTNFLAEDLNEMSSITSVSASFSVADTSERSHQHDLLPYDRQLDYAEDHRQDNYIVLEPTEYKKKIVDSSSSSCSSDSNISIPKSTTENFPLTAEEEDKLLESEDDEDDNDDNKSDQSFDSNDTRPPFKYTDVVMDGINIVVNKTFPKWDRKCVPSKDLQQPITLNDLGYTSLNENDSGDSDSVSSKSTTYEPLQELSSFKVTLSSNQQRICEQVDNLNKNFSFKKPSLPPIKRPPTRPKRLGSDSHTSHSASSSVSDVSESRMRNNFTTFDNNRSFPSSQKEDDVISLSASTIMDPDNITFDRDSIKTEVMSDIDIDAREGDGTNNFSHNNVENWLAVQNSNSVKNANKNDSVPPLTIFPGTKGPRVHFLAVPSFFNGICYRYFFNEDCTSIKCKTSHYINKQLFTKKCKTHIKSSTEMQTIYDYCLRFHKLIPQIYPCLIKGFAHFKMQNSLLACIDDFFALKHIINCQDAVERIIEAFEETELTFSEVIDKLSINIGFERHKKLAEILLDLLTNRPNVFEYWEQIKRITLAVNFIHPKFFNRLLFKFLNQFPLNKELGKDIYIVVIKNNFTDLSSVSSELLTSITTMFQFGDNSLANSIAYNLSKEHEKFEQSRLQNQNAQDFTNSNENLSQFETTNKGNPVKSFYSMDSTDRLNIQFDTKSNGKRRVKPSRFTDRLNIQVENGRNTNQQLECSSSRSTSSQYSNNSRELSPIPTVPYIPSAIIPQNMVPFSDTIWQQQPQTTPITSTQLTTSIPQRIIRNNNGSSYPNDLDFRFSSPVPKKTMQNVDISCHNEYNLCPDVPILGKFKYGKDFNFNTSLHHLLPTAAYQVPLNNSDIKKLHKAIENRNGDLFLHLFNKNKGPATVQSFVSMSIVNLKNCIGEYNALEDLMENMEMVQPDFKKDPLLKGVIEVIVFNLLFLFERKCQYDDARKLIENFCDWDSLISSKIFGMYKYTPMGRYLLLAKLLAKAKAYYKVYDILECDNLRLLKSQSEWPLHSSLRSDLELRNAVLADFFSSAYRQNLGAESIFEFYKNIFQSEEIWEFDAGIYFNPMLEYMLDNQRTLGLKRCLANIDVFYKYMDKNILRGFIVYMDKFTYPENKYELFEFGIKKGVYSNITGLESTLIIKNDIIDCELLLTLGYYLNKLRSQNLTNNLRIQITFVKEVVKSPSILVNRVRSLSDVKRSIINSLFNLGIHLPNAENKNCTEVEIDKNILKHFLRNISLNK